MIATHPMDKIGGKGDLLLLRPFVRHLYFLSLTFFWESLNWAKNCTYVRPFTTVKLKQTRQHRSEYGLCYSCKEVQYVYVPTYVIL